MRGGDNDPVRDFFQDANIPRIPRGILIAGVVILLVISMLMTAFFTVEADEVGVVMRFGAYVRQAEPGLHFKLPLGLESVQRVKALRVLKREFGFRTERADIRTRFSPRRYDLESKMLTGDLNVADVRWIVQYRIADPAKFLFGNRAPIEALDDAAQIAMRTTVGDYTVTAGDSSRKFRLAKEGQVIKMELPADSSQ